MSKPGIVYRGGFTDLQGVNDAENALDQRDHYIYIYDYGTLIDDSATEAFIPLDLAGVPLTSRVVDTDEDKFTSIRSTQVDIVLHTSDSIDLNTFCEGEDNRYLLKWYVAGQLFYQGFLLQDDMSQNFLPDPNDLVLSFTDNLKVLGDIPLVDSDDENPTGYNKIMSYIVWALRKTGLTLPINVINNVREEHTAPLVTDDVSFVAPNTIIAPLNNLFHIGHTYTIAGSGLNNGLTFTVLGSVEILFETLLVDATVQNETGVEYTFQDTNPHLYDSMYLEARTFESEINVSVSCKEVLEIILGEQCCLFQQWGEWYIVSVDERDDQFQRVAHFLTDGTFTDFTTDANYFKNIGVDETIHMINADQLVRPIRPYNNISLEFPFDTPLEIPANRTFTLGTERPESPSDNTVTRYDPTFWTARKGVPGAYVSEGIEFYIEVTYDANGYEDERYMVLTPEAVHNASSVLQTYIESEAIPVSANDKFTASVDWRYSTSGDGGPSTINRMKIYLAGSDGSHWLLGHRTIGDSTTPFKWWNTSNFTANTSAGNENAPDFAEIDEEDWQSQSFEAPPIPVEGNLYIWLHQANQNSMADDDRIIHYANLEWTYQPYINGTYQQYNSQRWKVTQASGTYNAKRDKEVRMSDSPKKLFKGAMFKKSGTVYYLSELFYKAYVTVPPLMPSDSEFKKFGEWQSWWVWNQYRLSTRTFEMSLQGLDTNAMYNVITVNPCSLLHKYYITDEDVSSNTKQFMLLHHESNWERGEWTGFFAEVMDFNSGKDYDDTITFKFISE